MYRKDATSNTDKKKPKFSMEMQKVMMLPHLPGIKTALFTRRIIMINESIVPLGKFKDHRKNSESMKAMGYIWHEAIQGRKDEDVASVLLKFLSDSCYRDAETIVIWCDNCTGRNKNWALYSGIVQHMINSKSNLEQLTLRYFEKGHTFMSADSFHHQIEENIRRKKKLYDFNDYVECVEKGGMAIEMKSEDFLDISSGKSSAKDVRYPRIADISEILFKKGKTKMFWKTSFGDTTYQSSDLLQKKVQERYNKGTPSRGKGPARGINLQKKNDIIKKLSDIMPANRRMFWNRLLENETSADLSINLEHLGKQD